MFDFLNNKKVLITGNTGFKGTWLTSIISQYTNNLFGISNRLITTPSHYSLFKKKKNKTKIYRYI